MSLLRHLILNNAHDLAGLGPLWLDGTGIGWLRPTLARAMAAADGDLCRVEPESGGLNIHSDGRPAAALSQALDAVLTSALPDLPRLGERYAVVNVWGRPVRCTVDRALVADLGLRSYGVHLTGFVRRQVGGRERLFLWVAERAHDKRTYPGRLDNTVAGGQPAHLSFAENLIKECAEEAGFGPEISARAHPTGVVTYTRRTARGLKPDLLACYDLQLGEDERPRPHDGEVAAFHLMPAEEVAEIITRTDRFKTNCNLVVIDFLIRHGLITPETEPHYVALATRLHGPRPLPSPLPPPLPSPGLGSTALR